jgi:hypothetical protein
MPQTTEQKNKAKLRRVFKYAEECYFTSLGLVRISIGCGWGMAGDDGIFAISWDRYYKLWGADWLWMLY